jgi:hypothetical protein
MDSKPVTVGDGRNNRRERRVARKNPALGGGTTREWMGVFNLITTDEQPEGYVPMERRPEPRRVVIDR